MWRTVDVWRRMRGIVRGIERWRGLERDRRKGGKEGREKKDV